MLDLHEPDDFASASRSSNRSVGSFAVSIAVHAALAFGMWCVVYSTVQREPIHLSGSSIGETNEVLWKIDTGTKPAEPVVEEGTSGSTDPARAIEKLIADSMRTEAFDTKHFDFEPASIDFFGIHAYGSRFVFLLDISYSMDARGGERYRRACDELVRSVSNLGPGQSYYVFLFSWNIEPMFYEPEQRYVDVAPGHARELQRWVKDASLGAGTDPRRALSLATVMQPDAVFLLSDGQFNKPRTPMSESGWLDADGSLVDVNVLAGVEKFYRDIPIHTVAFENPYTRDAMKRIASATGGRSRYVKTRSLVPVDSDRFTAALQRIERKYRHGGDPERECRTRLSLARELISQGELLYAEYLVRPLRNARGSAGIHPSLWEEVFGVLDAEIGQARLEDYAEPPGSDTSPASVAL